MQAGGLYGIKFRTCDEASKDEKQYDAADKSASKQQVCVLDGSRLHCAKNCTHTPSASGSYSRPADKNLIVLKKFKSYTFSDIYLYFPTTSHCNNRLTSYAMLVCS